MALRINSRFREALKKIQKPQTGWMDEFPAVIGKYDGTVLTGTPGVIYVRNILNGQILKVYNSAVPNIFMLQVDVGHRIDEPNKWQVKGTRETFSSPAGSGTVPFHAAQHALDGGDIDWVERKRIKELTILVKDAAGFIVVVGSATIPTQSGVAIVETEADGSAKQLDLSAYVPSSGAVYVNVEVDDDGVLSLHAGTAFDAVDLGTTANVAVPDAGKYMLGYVLLFESQTELLNRHIRVIFPLHANLNNILGLYVGLTGDETVAGIKTFSSFPVTPSAAPTTDYQTANKKYVDDGLATKIALNDAEGEPADVITGIAADGTSVYGARRDHVHHTDVQQLHGLARWNGATGQTTFDLPDIADSINAVTLAGVESDPLVYSLSADGTQIILDSALGSDTMVIAHYQIALS